MTPFTEKVISVILAIPEGKVMTYGQIAAAAGSPRAARQVVRILHSMSMKYKLPWHRVVNAQGKIALPDEESRFKQVLYLSSEGIDVDDNGYIDLTSYQFKPDEREFAGE